MQGYNIIVVFHENADKILMCKRRKIHIKDYQILSAEK